jgi:hypothetical protein
MIPKSSATYIVLYIKSCSHEVAKHKSGGNIPIPSDGHTDISCRARILKAVMALCALLNGLGALTVKRFPSDAFSIRGAFFNKLALT